MTSPSGSRPPHPERREVQALPSALDQAGSILEALGTGGPALFLDYDGTLTPIVRRPEDARLDEPMKAILSRLAARIPVAIVSGRDRSDVEQLVGLEPIVYAGSHGFDIRGPGDLRYEQPDAGVLLPRLDSAERRLKAELAGIDGVLVERKRYSLAVHFRNVTAGQAPAVRRSVDREHEAAPGLRKTAGKMVMELSPDVDWDKGHAVVWLLGALPRQAGDTIPLYIGDDLTDEDALRRLPPPAVGIIAGPGHDLTYARYRLADTVEVHLFLELLASKLLS